MSDADLNKRLRDMEGGDAKPSKAKSAAKIAAIATACIAGGGAVYYFGQQAGSGVGELPTVQPAEFQTEGSGFGDLKRPPQQQQTQPPATVAEAPAEPAPAALETGASDEVLAELRSLRAELDTVRQGANAADAAAQADAVSRLQQDLDRLRAEAERTAAADAERQAELQRQLEARDLEIRGLQGDLDLARLAQPPAIAGEPVTAGLATAPFTPEDADLAARRAAAQAAAEAEAALVAQRIASPMVAFGGGGGAALEGAAQAVGLGDGASSQQAARLSSDERFVREAGQPAPVERAQIIVNPANTVTQGTIIQAAMETAIDSSLPGAIRASVTTDVPSYDGSRILIPRGSKLIGKYSSEVGTGQSRVLVAWERIIMPDAQSVQLSAYGADELGRSGTAGRVNNHLLKRFGSAALISLISAIPAALDNGDGSAGNAAASELASSAEDQSSSLMEPYLEIPPTISVPQGTQITVFVDRDLEIF